MEILQTDSHYILIKGQNSLWFDKRTGLHEYKSCWDLASASNPQCLGSVHAILGKLVVHPDLPPRLGLVTGVREVGAPVWGGGVGCRIFGITKVCFLPISPQSLDSNAISSLGLLPCHKHQAQNSVERRNISLPDPRAGLSKTFGTLRSVTSSIRSATVNVAATATGQSKARKEDRDKERYERRIIDELLKMFNVSESGESFYFCNEMDITSSLQRQHSDIYDTSLPVWRRADDRFFWNKNMMSDFMRENNTPDPWITPIIQGFVQIEHVPLDTPDLNAKHAQPGDFYSLCLISRRSRHRAGTRYKRRGVDDEGHVANYVETEQTVALNTHVIAFTQTGGTLDIVVNAMSYIQVRGSVPVYWSQPGYKYRPPPRLDRGADETHAAFAFHFAREIQAYKHVNCISLVEQGGKEKVISDAYTDNILRFNSPDLTYITFDFHEYCRGLRYENVSLLIEGIADVLNSSGYCWVDKQGVICTQSAVCRVNCIDCLDRTNVVQTSIARNALERQFVKLGVLSPDQPLPDLCRAALNSMWANNGDTLSRQYAGTQALKGDFTRTGERKFSSLMKDGMNSANRYYMNRFKDAYRQATIDHMLGTPQTADLLTSTTPEEEDMDSNAVAQHVKSVIDDATKLLVPEAHTILGAWGLIDADPQSGDPDQVDMDTILLLTRDSYYIAEYDEECDRINNYQRVSLIDLDCVEVGNYTFPSVFKQSRSHHCLRLCYQVDKQGGYFHMLRAMNIRFFNNMAVTIRTEEERIESVKSIGDTFAVGVEAIGCDAPLHIFDKLERRKNRGAKASQLLTNPLRVISQPLKQNSEAFKSVGSKAFNNVTSGLAKLNPMSGFKKRSKGEEVLMYAEKPAISVECLPAHTEELPPPKEGYSQSELHISVCGVLASSVTTQAHHSPPLSPFTPKTLSDSSITNALASEGGLVPPFLPPAVRSNTPEILISSDPDTAKSKPNQQNMLPSFSQRVRKLSHSSDDVENRETGDAEGDSIFRASSAANLQLHLTQSHSESVLQRQSNAYSNPVSPLFTKDGVFGAPLSSLVKGVQSLAPGAGKLARGMQTIGASPVDPHKLLLERRKVNDNDKDWSDKVNNCTTKIIQF